MGDYELGYADIGSFSLAKAMAISAAFPGGIGPLVLKSQNFEWKKRAHWGATEAEMYQVPFKSLHLYGGGLYDNLGLEPLFDVARQELKTDYSLKSPVRYLVVSDGGAALPRTVIPHPLNPFRFKRIADITLDQSRALRVRAFVNFLQKNSSLGAFVGIGAVAEQSIRQFSKGRESIADRLLTQNWLSQEEVKSASTYNTNLSLMSESHFDLLARHGYETVKWNMEIMSQVCLKEP